MGADPVNVVYGLIPKAFPLTISGTRAAIASMGEARMVHMIELCGGSVERSVFTKADVFSSQGDMCLGKERLRIDVGGHLFTDYCIVPDGTPAPYIHNARVYGCFGDVFYAERSKALADAVMHLCQNRIVARIRTKDDRTSRLVRTYFIGEGIRQSWMFHEPSRFYYERGIHSDSTLVFRRLMFAVACLRGDANCSDRRRGVLIPQKHKPAELLAMQGSSTLNSYFAELDLDSGIGRGWLDSVESEFGRNAAAGYIVPLRSQGVALRFRKIGDFNFAGVFFPFTRDIVLSPEAPEHFSHEYGHALFHAYGRGRDPGFLECHRRYTELLRNDPVVSRYDNLDYYLSKTEAFARMYNRFIFLKFGNGVLNTHAEDRVHPRDPKLDGMIDRYFTGFFAGMR